MNSVFDEMIQEALQMIADAKAEIYTLAFYHDHESSEISVCIDTEEQSSRTILESNKFTRKYFQKTLAEGDAEGLKLWNFQAGRSFSLGNFEYVSVSARPVPSEYEDGSSNLYLEMIRAIERNKSSILQHTHAPEQVMFCCSSADAEVQYIWQ
ncbi:MAG: hypothetical protein IPK50_08525 [Fibrobacterota bacterium]|nr:MAG: hypothetical protein IPK50_08525 [Fibrobacterota bacterium]